MYPTRSPASNRSQQAAFLRADRTRIPPRREAATVSEAENVRDSQVSPHRQSVEMQTPVELHRLSGHVRFAVTMTTAWATSSGIPLRPTGILRTASFAAPCIISVSINEGATAFTVIP